MAKLLDEFSLTPTGDGEVLGTVPYLAPKQAVGLARDLVREHPAEGAYAMILVRACGTLAHVCSDTARHAEAGELFQEALRNAERHTDPDPPAGPRRAGPRWS